MLTHSCGEEHERACLSGSVIVHQCIHNSYIFMWHHANIWRSGRPLLSVSNELKLNQLAFTVLLHCSNNY